MAMVFFSLTVWPRPVSSVKPTKDFLALRHKLRSRQRSRIDLARAVEVFDPRVRPNNDVVEVQEAEDPLEARKGGVHHALEDAWRIAKTERHHAELVHPRWQMKAERSFARSVFLICQKPIEPKVETNLRPWSSMRVSSMRGRGYTSFLVAPLRRR